MRIFKNFLGEEVDLDDSNTYNHLPQNIQELRKLMFSEIGYSYLYMNFWHSDVFSKNDGGQKDRILKLIENFIKNECTNRRNITWTQEQIYIFQDEIENMC